MSLLSWTKQRNTIKSILSDPNAIVVYYKNGTITNIKPELKGTLYDKREIYYNAKYILSDGKLYNLENIKSIASIKLPKFKHNSDAFIDVTKNLDYVLQRKANSLYKKGETKLAITLLKKATDMMLISDIHWKSDDYMKLVYWLIADNRNKEADIIEKTILEHFTGKSSPKFEMKTKAIENAKRLGTDLVEADYSLCCCPECAKYRGRWFSISGRDKRFPKMPDINNCECHGISFFPVLLGRSSPNYCPKYIDIIEYSNRPFVDDRTDTEKEIFNIEKREKEIEKWYEPYKRRLFAIKEKDRKKYFWVCKHLPDIAPKSFSDYMRMKNGDTKKFQILAEKSIVKDVNLYSEEADAVEMEQLKDFRKKYLAMKKECKERRNVYE